MDEHCLLFEAYCAAGDWERDCYHMVKKGLEIAVFDGSLLHLESFQASYPLLIGNAFQSACIKYILFDALVDCAYKNSALQKVAWHICKISEMDNFGARGRRLLEMTQPLLFF